MKKEIEYGTKKVIESIDNLYNNVDDYQTDLILDNIEPSKIFKLIEKIDEIFEIVKIELRTLSIPLVKKEKE